jgi:hypothetical protein
VETEQYLNIHSYPTVNIHGPRYHQQPVNAVSRTNGDYRENHAARFVNHESHCVIRRQSALVAFADSHQCALKGYGSLFPMPRNRHHLDFEARVSPGRRS